jgi:hypothetical protein
MGGLMTNERFRAEDHLEIAALKRTAWQPVLADWDGSVTSLTPCFLVAPEQDALRDTNTKGWPTCSSCQQALSMIAQLDLSSLPDEGLATRSGGGIVGLYGCLRPVECPEGIFTAVRIPPSSKPRVPSDIAIQRIMSWSAFDDYPDWAQAAETLKAIGLTPRTYGERPESGTKLAGWPEWFNKAVGRYPGCPICRTAMSELIVQLEFYDPDEYTYQGWLFQCPAHRDQMVLDANGE